jgi:hypothetical protein
MEEQLKNNVLHLLKIGTIQVFQIEDYIRLEAIPEFRIAPLVREINEAYQRNNPC